MATANVEFLNPFVSASFNVIDTVLCCGFERGAVQARAVMKTSEHISVVIQVTGDVTGNITIAMSRPTAVRIASIMLGSSVVTFDDMAESALTELGNMITGNGLTVVSELGYACSLGPPMLIRRADEMISPRPIPTVIVPLEMELGNIYLYLGLQETRKEDSQEPEPVSA